MKVWLLLAIIWLTAYSPIELSRVIVTDQLLTHARDCPTLISYLELIGLIWLPYLAGLRIIWKLLGKMKPGQGKP